MHVAKGWWWLGRIGLCLPYAWSGVSKLLDFPGAVAEQAHYGMLPPALYAAGAIVVQLGGCLAVLFCRGRWRAGGAIVLALFTIVATVIGHPYWTMAGMQRVHTLNAFLAHAGLVGGFVLIAAQALHRGGVGGDEEEEEEEEEEE